MKTSARFPGITNEGSRRVPQSSISTDKTSPNYSSKPINRRQNGWGVFGNYLFSPTSSRRARQRWDVRRRAKKNLETTSRWDLTVDHSFSSCLLSTVSSWVFLRYRNSNILSFSYLHREFLYLFFFGLQGKRFNLASSLTSHSCLGEVKRISFPWDAGSTASLSSFISFSSTINSSPLISFLFLLSYGEL